MSARPLLLLFALACAPKTVPTVDPTLPEATERVAAVAPRTILEQASRAEEPSHRGRSLEILLHLASARELPDLATRALWDPDAWVQRKAVGALAERIDEPAAADKLKAFVRRTDGLADPHARAVAARHLGTERDPDLADALTTAWKAESTPWRRAPLQLAAARQGDAQALTELAQTLEEAEIGLEPAFMLDLGRSGHTELIPALTEAYRWVEPDMRIAVATARLLLGDPAAEKVLRSTLTDAPEIAVLEALDFLTRIDHPATRSLLNKVKASTPLAHAYAELAIQARGDGPDGAFEANMLSPDPELRELTVRFAREALARDDLPRRSARVASKVIERGLRDDMAAIRVSALRAPRGLPSDSKIRPMLTDELLEVRIEVAGVLLAPTN